MTRLDLISLTIIGLAYGATAFLGQAPTFRVRLSSLWSSTTVEYTLEGKTIQNPFTPVNNMLLLKKADIVDQTGGGIFLTGKVRYFDEVDRKYTIHLFKKQTHNPVHSNINDVISSSIM